MIPGIKNMLMDPVEIEVAVQSLPFEQYKQHPVEYDVQYRPGVKFNYGLNPMNTEAGYIQDDYAHNVNLKEYVKEGLQQGLSMDEALEFAKMKDQKLNAKYWNEDKQIRRPLGAGSSVISDARINGNGDIELTFNRGKTYTYEGGTNPDKELTELLTSYSIGNQLNRYRPGSWANRH